MNKDTLDFKLIREPNLSYEHEMKSMKSWMEDDDRWEEDKPQKFYVRFNLIINGEEIKHYTSYENLLRVNKSIDCYKDWDGQMFWHNREYSLFQPFTCSCGDSGCAGIWDGIHMKVRGHTVEWRIKKDAGYDFLPKLFFSFDKSEYFGMLDRLKLLLAEFSKEGTVI